MFKTGLKASAAAVEIMDEGLGSMHNHYGLGHYDTEVIEISAWHKLLEKTWNSGLLSVSPDMKAEVEEFCEIQAYIEAEEAKQK